MREKILDLVEKYFKETFKEEKFIPGQSKVFVAKQVNDAEDLKTVVDSLLDLNFTHGKYSELFEKALADYSGLRYAIPTNSGSSANLVALASLTSNKLNASRIQKEDEIITIATGFPTTINPIIQNNLIPVFVDISLPTYNIDVTQLEAALSKKTKAVMMAHTLGNPFDLGSVTKFCEEHNLYLIEDACDALGSEYNGKKVATFGELATFSFYPAHHITMGEGGAVVTDNPRLNLIAKSFRDWGRDCWCRPGKDNTCKRRFGWKLGNLPYGYDHKYIYTHIGYNLKPTHMQAALGYSQLKKIEVFAKKRRHNFNVYYKAFKKYEDFFVLPTATKNSNPNWFGFPLTVKKESPFTKAEIVDYLEERNIATRMLLAGNIVRQPAYEKVKYRLVGDLKISDMVMESTFWIGVHPAITGPMQDYVIEVFKDFISKKA